MTNPQNKQQLIDMLINNPIYKQDLLEILSIWFDDKVRLQDAIDCYNSEPMNK